LTGLKVMTDGMTFEMFGAGCFGVVIGYVAWHVFRGGETSFDVKQLGAFVAALLGAAVLAVFPAGTTLFAAYSAGLALGFFLDPISRIIVMIFSSISQSPSRTPNLPQWGAISEVSDQSKYIDEHWPEIERVVLSALERNQGSARQSHILALPLDEAGRVSVLRRYARTYPERTSFSQGFLGWTLRIVERPSTAGERDRRQDSAEWKA